MNLRDCRRIALIGRCLVKKKDFDWYIPIKFKDFDWYIVVVVVVVVFTLKAVPVSTQYFLTSVLVQLTRTPSVVTG